MQTCFARSDAYASPEPDYLWHVLEDCNDSASDDDAESARSSHPSIDTYHSFNSDEDAHMGS